MKATLCLSVINIIFACLQSTPFEIDFVKKQNKALVQEMHKFKRQSTKLQVNPTAFS